MAENIVLNKVPSNTASARNIVLDKLPVPPFTVAKIAKFYWRFEDEPTSPFQYLGQQTVGFPLQVPVEGVGKSLRISMIGVSDTGVPSTYDPREGVQTTVYIPTAAETIVVYGDEVVTYNGEVVTYG